MSARSYTNDQTSPEQWLLVVGHHGYEVSDRGRVRSSLRGGRVLRPGLASTGYYTVALRGVTRTVHSLVAEAFIGPRGAGLQVRHVDGDRRNNNLSNISYGTPKDNRADSERHGTAVRGEKYSTAKLTDSAARYIRAQRGVTPQSALARLFGVSPAAIQAVHDGRTWTHV